MPQVSATASVVIPAPPEVVYGIIADYHAGHPAILPPRFFQNLTVLEGGIGAGTRIALQLRSWGTARDLQARVTEPLPGRRLVETYEDGTETAFTVEPESGGREARVTISTTYEKAGLRGWIEGMLVPGFLRSVYAEELRMLSDAARGRAHRA